MLLHRREVVNQPHQAIGLVKIQPLGWRISKDEVAHYLRRQHINNVVCVHASTLTGAHLFRITGAINKFIWHWYWRINVINLASDPLAGIIRTTLRRVVTTKRLDINAEQPPPPRPIQPPVQLYLPVIVPNRVLRVIVTTIGNRFSIAIHADEPAIF